MRLLRHSLPFFAGLGLLFLSACQSNPSSTTEAASSESVKGSLSSPIRTVTIREGTAIEIRLVNAVGSAHNRSGDTFLATLNEPVVMDNWVVIPKGAKVTGRVIAAQPSGHLQTPAELALTLTSVEIDGKEHDIYTSEYSRRAKSHGKRNATWIGGAAAGGALIGALAGGGKGAAIGAGAGAGGGTAAAYATGKKDILLPPETRLRFTLREPLTITKAA